ncbi:MAG: ester cyclase [Paracoccaceae bacterium]|nr:ester cyclase [Paracoccaceae bacterium]
MTDSQRQFRDLPDFIIGITREIWEDRNTASLRQYYAPDVVMRSPASVVTGNETVIADTMATLAEFPDRTLLGEDVIWSGDAESGWLSSHRLLSTATHLGHGTYGPPSGRTLAYRIIADCHVVAGGGVIDEEWLIRDQGAIVRQIGKSPREFAAEQIRLEGGPDTATRPTDVAGTTPTKYLGEGNRNSWGERYRNILEQIMAGELAVIPREYDRACHLEYPGGITGHSHSDADRFWLGLRSSFPDAEFKITHQIGREDPAMPPRAALRWRLTGTHGGAGHFGPPTGADVHVMGACHAEFGPWGLRREFVLYDETAIWKQLLLACPTAFGS